MLSMDGDAFHSGNCLKWRMSSYLGKIVEDAVESRVLDVAELNHSEANSHSLSFGGAYSGWEGAHGLVIRNLAVAMVMVSTVQSSYLKGRHLLA